MSTTIKQKVGICLDCKDGKEKPLIAKRCRTHYWQHRAKVKNPKSAWKEEKRKELNVFFASQLLEVPKCCENCNEDLSYQKKAMPKSIIAHILPKRENGGFPKVATHPKNKMFLCLQCHHNYDDLGSDFAKQMKILPTIKQRFNEFKHLLTTSELQRIPEFLKN